MALRKENDYFAMFAELVRMSLEAAQYLKAAINDFDMAKIDELRANMHNIEHEADIKKHDMIQKLMREFITPIEREDIMELAQVTDDLTDSIEDVMIKMYLYDISSIRPEALLFTDVIVGCCSSLDAIAKEFSNFRKSKTIYTSIIEVNRLEEEGDTLYEKAMRRLFHEPASELERIVWRDIFHALERCCDACEHVCDVIEAVIMKNT